MWLARASVAAGVGICGLGFAVYDSRWPFGSRRKIHPTDKLPWWSR
jgi:hypothetical protein